MVTVVISMQTPKYKKSHWQNTEQVKTGQTLQREYTQSQVSVQESSMSSSSGAGSWNLGKYQQSLNSSV